MKLQNKVIIFTLSLFLAITLVSCDIVDSLKKYPVNIPISVAFSSSGSNTIVAEGGTHCLTNEDAYQEYEDKINSVKLVKMAYRTTSFSPSSLQGNVSVSVKNDFGVTLFTHTIPNVKPGDYINTPYELQLTNTEIQAVNTYLKNSLAENGGLCLSASLNVNVTSGGTTNSIAGYVDIVFEAEAEL